MEIEFTNGLKRAFSLIEEAGFSCYLVGGAIRDKLIGDVINDYDLATSATLLALDKIFKDYHHKIYSKGETMSVKILGDYLEITPFKGKDIYEDLRKRDFTINAMAYNPNEGLIDPFKGVCDINRRLIRCVNDDAEAVFTSDPIRILRGLKCAAVKEFKIDSKTSLYMNKLAYLISSCHTERIKPLIDPIMVSEIPSLYIRDYIEVWDVIFPGLKKCEGFDQKNRKWHHLNVLDHILKVLDSTRNNIVLRYAALLHDICKPDAFTEDENGIGHFYGHERLSADYAYKRLNELHYSGTFIARVCRLIYFHDYQLMNTEKSLLKFLYRFGTEDLDLYFGLKRADILGQNPSLIDRIYKIDEITEHIRLLLKQDKIITYRNLKINGSILLEIGYEPEMIGRALKIILERVQKKELANTPDKLYEFARRLRYDLIRGDE